MFIFLLGKGLKQLALQCTVIMAQLKINTTKINILKQTSRHNQALHSVLVVLLILNNTSMTDLAERRRLFRDRKQFELLDMKLS